METLYADHQVFTICGRVFGEVSDDNSAFVVADSATEIVQSFAEWGFEVTSMASLADVGQNLEILEALAARDPRVAPEEFVDLAPANGGERRDERQVFTFVGMSTQSASDTLQAGFAVAPDREFLSDYLRSMGFEPYSVMSYAEVRELCDVMRRVAAGAEDDPSNTVHLKP
jgi:hypothetical protein